MISRSPELYDSSLSPTTQREALTSGRIPVAVYGLGKMGLPLSAVFADVTGNVTGVDVDPAVVECVTDGRSHVTGEPGLGELVAAQVADGRLRATTDGAAAAREARVHVLIVPTLIDEQKLPDLSTIESVARDVAAGLSPGDLVIVESTVPPGTCRDVLQPFLADESGLEVGEFGVAFCPERTSSGTALRDIRGEYPKVVGGVDGESSRAAALVYDELSSNEVHVVSDATTAEAVKVFEGVYRDVNIALANELARTADEFDISVREAFATANRLPMCSLHDPGPGVGGHCIPYYPHFLLAQATEPLALVRTARSVNESMPTYTVSRLEAILEERGIELEDASVLVLGFTYRPGVEEIRSSPAIEITDQLLESGATVYGVDPLVDPSEFGARAVDAADLGRSADAFDAAIVVTPHEEFETLEWRSLEPMVVLDGRDAFTRDLESTHHDVSVLGGSTRGGPTVLDGDDAIRFLGSVTTPNTVRGDGSGHP